jgi:hypothetical protein
LGVRDIRPSLHWALNFQCCAFEKLV